MAGGLEDNPDIANLLESFETEKGAASPEVATPGNPITAAQLVKLPLSEWDAAIEAADPPANLDEFMRNLDNSVRPYNGAGSDMNFTYLNNAARSLATGALDGRVANYGLEATAHAYMPATHQPGGLQEIGEMTKLYEETFQTIHDYNESHDVDMTADQAGQLSAAAYGQRMQAIGEKLGSVYATLKPPEPEADADAKLEAGAEAGADGAAIETPVVAPENPVNLER